MNKLHNRSTQLGRRSKADYKFCKSLKPPRKVEWCGMVEWVPSLLLEGGALSYLPLGISRFCQAVSTLVPGSVDTSPSLQKTQLPDWDNRARGSIL
ncbi:hypothetical protein Taro_032583 [Colocasia esculenta]|uniref:Uncharacterized protein n=1 Tax=Colocasia esculenta TaxID=4460 RepID=A0A843VLP7_COLES|nr:hypothetical protein [Colocasia esculenta]